MVSTPVNVTLLAPGIGRLAPACAVQWSDGHALQPWQSQFCELLGQIQWNGRQLPVAELLAGMERDDDHETGVNRPSLLVCADPVHLRAGRDTATLVPAAMLALSETEADALLTSINEFLQADGLRLHRSDASHWFMQGMDGRTLLSHPPGFLAQRNASAFLPDNLDGALDADQWKRLMTELQMLLHAHPVNAEREQRGLMPVNSLWFWGGAALASVDSPSSSSSVPEAVPEAAPEAVSGTVSGTAPVPAPRIYADEAFAVALADHLGLDCQPLEAFDAQDVSDTSVILVDTRLEHALQAQDETGVNAALQRFMEGCVDGLQNRLQHAEDIRLDVLDEDGMRGRLDPDSLRAAAEAAQAAESAAKKAAKKAARKKGSGSATGTLPGRVARRLWALALAGWRRLAGPRQ